MKYPKVLAAAVLSVATAPAFAQSYRGSASLRRGALGPNPRNVHGSY
jgi:hypothetical protein